MENKEFVFIISNSYDAMDRTAAALQLASNMVTFGAKVDFFLTHEGVHLAKKGFAESITWLKGFSPVSELLNTLVDDFGCKFYIAANFVKSYGLEKTEWIKNAEVKPGTYLGELLMTRQNVTL